MDRTFPKGRTSIHGLATVYRALCEGRLRRYTPYKGLRPLRRFAAIPVDRLCLPVFLIDGILFRRTCGRVVHMLSLYAL